MKTVVKIEIALLVIVLLVALGMVLASEGGLNLFREPEVALRESLPVPTEAPMQAPEATEAPVEPMAEEKDPRVISAAKYFAFDVREDAYLLNQGEGNERVYPASITKLLTCYTILQHMQPDTRVTVGDALNLVQWDSSVAGLKEGDVLSIEQLIAAMLLPSGNDAAQVAAVATGRAIAGDNSLDYETAVVVFVEEMNRQAKNLGMENSHFANPDGFHHENHYTTMNDLVTLCKQVLKEQTILKYACTPKVTVTLPDRELVWENTNLFLHEEIEMYRPNAIGMKTGYTDAAGNCLMSAFFMEDRILLIGVFGCPPFTEDRYLDTLAIYNNL